MLVKARDPENPQLRFDPATFSLRGDNSTKINVGGKTESGTKNTKVKRKMLTIKAKSLKMSFVCLCVQSTYMCAADALQKQACNLCLAVELCLGQSEILFSLKQQQQYYHHSQMLLQFV